ncbi:uncharacterized protein LOC134237037 [Saccostrea cucullata]|uniref:uncharacterized protein LOC134237037 n=1 Tax=Saccostrea cuccullata TaxID=36930 RepID=UPI002ED6624D
MPPIRAIKSQVTAKSTRASKRTKGARQQQGRGGRRNLTAVHNADTRADPEIEGLVTGTSAQAWEENIQSSTGMAEEHVPLTISNKGRQLDFSTSWPVPEEAALSPADVARDNIKKEIDKGQMAGPFKSRPMSNLRVSPLGVVPKKTEGEFRVIHHLSYPTNNSVNDFIDEELCSVNYTKFDEAISMVQRLGRGSYLAKSDIKSAFRLMPIWPGNFELLGFKFDGCYYFDKCLPFGCSISCATFEKFSSLLEWLVRKRATSREVLHYLDDFLFGGHTADECQMIVDNFIQVCQELGVPIAWEKSEGPQELSHYFSWARN